jgi:hypothetical protein
LKLNLKRWGLNVVIEFKWYALWINHKLLVPQKQISWRLLVSWVTPFALEACCQCSRGTCHTLCVKVLTVGFEWNLWQTASLSNSVSILFTSCLPLVQSYLFYFNKNKVKKRESCNFWHHHGIQELNPGFPGWYQLLCWLSWYIYGSVLR